MMHRILDFTFPLWFVIVAALCVLGARLWYQAWQEAKRDERLELLKSRPMPPLPRRIQRAAQEKGA